MKCGSRVLINDNNIIQADSHKMQWNTVVKCGIQLERINISMIEACVCITELKMQNNCQCTEKQARKCRIEWYNL